MISLWRVSAIVKLGRMGDNTGDNEAGYHNLLAPVKSCSTLVRGSALIFVLLQVSSALSRELRSRPVSGLVSNACFHWYLLYRTPRTVVPLKYMQTAQISVQ